MKQALYRWIFYKVLGWKIEGTLPEDIKKCILLVGPHTSWHDFYIGVLTRGILNKQMDFVAKKELFIFPFGYYFKWMGGTALDRAKNENKVEAIARIFNEKKEFRLAISPEGTRKKVTRWRTGFYYIALQAQVPIVPVVFDYKSKKVDIKPAFHPTGTIDVDLPKLEAYFLNIQGKIKENSYTRGYEN